MSENANRSPRLSVEGFGPITSSCPIVIKPMTVFVGPSNTGKSYLALLLHAISTSIHNVSSGRTTGFSIQDIDHYESYKPKYLSLFDDIYAVYSLNSNQNDIIELYPDDLSPNSHELIRLFETALHREISDALKYSVSTYFQTSDIEGLADEIHLDGFYNHVYPRNIYDRDDLDTSITWSDVWSIALLDDDFGVFSYSDIPPFEPLRLPVEAWLRILRSYHLDRDVLSTSHMVQIRYHIEEALLSILRELPRSIYFPAARSGIIASRHLMIANAVSNEYLRDVRKDSRSHRDAIPREFLRHLLSIDTTNTTSDDRVRTVADVIENAIMNGEIEVRSAQYGPPELVYSSKGFEIPLTRSSSMVTELAPIILFLRHIVRMGNLLIVEEPEAHLHPAAQQQMAAALAFMVRSGLRVLITTHSHYMVEQLGNFVAVSTLDEDLRKRVLKLDGALGEEDIYLNETEVAVYDFATDKSEDGSVVETVEFNQDYGYFPRDHNWAIADQMNRTQRVIEARIDQDDPVSTQ